MRAGREDTGMYLARAPFGEVVGLLCMSGLALHGILPPQVKKIREQPAQAKREAESAKKTPAAPSKGTKETPPF